MQGYNFYNYPKSLSIDDYRRCYDKALNRLIDFYPNSNIYKLGGEHLNPGISDLDFLVVSKGLINGNHLYLRNFPNECLTTGILVHEPFAVDENTFNKINRLTSYDLELIHQASKENIEHKDPSDSSKIHDLVKLAQYIVVNYPMNFIEYLNDGNINVRRSISKLKKLLLIEKLFGEVFEKTGGILDESFKDKLLELIEKHADYSRNDLGKRVADLLKEAIEQVKKIFWEFQECSKREFNLNLGRGSLSFKSYNIEFSERWEKGLYYNNMYYLPSNLGIINVLFTRIESRFLKNIQFTTPDVTFEELDELSNDINTYLRYCDNSKILTLIFDIDFSVNGHDSLKYRTYRVLSWFKTNLYALVGKKHD